MQGRNFVPLTVAATELGVSYRSLQHLIKSGEIPAVYPGANAQRARYIDRDVLEAAKQRRGGAVYETRELRPATA